MRRRRFYYESIGDNLAIRAGLKLGSACRENASNELGKVAIVRRKTEYGCVSILISNNTGCPYNFYKNLLQGQMKRQTSESYYKMRRVYF